MTNDHLSDWEIEELIIASKGDSQGDFRGDAMNLESDPAQPGSISADRPWQHLASCDLCSTHKNRLQELLLLYRDDAVQRTDTVLRRQGSSVSSLKKLQDASPHSWRWGMWKLSLALVLLLAVLLPHFHQHRQEIERHEAQIARDNLLLEQVDEEVNSSVPHPLESLTTLVVARENTNQ